MAIIARLTLDHRAADNIDNPGGQSTRSFEFVAGNHHGGTSGRCIAKHGVDLVASSGVEAGVGLVEQPQFGAPGHQTSQGGTSALTGRQLLHRHSGQSIGEAHAHQRLRNLGSGSTRSGPPEADVLGNSEIGVQPVRMTEQTDTRPQLLALGTQIAAQHRALPPGQRQQTSAEPEQAGLPCAIGTTQQHDVAAPHSERGAGESRKASEHSHRIDELDHGFHVASTLAATPHGQPSPVASTPVAEHPEPKQPWRTRNSSRWDRPKHPRDWRWYVGGTGRVLITLGVLMFGFVGYQLWGTGIQYAQAQDKLENEFETLLSSTTVVSTTVPPSTTSTTSTTVVLAPGETVPVTLPPVATAAPAPTVAAPPAPRRSTGFAKLEIPRIGAVDIVVEGVKVADLKKGPGHFPETPLPGQLGQAAIAGHRTTYGAPFGRIDEIEVGDEIIVTTVAGRYVYYATGTKIVAANAYNSAIPSDDPTKATLVLVSCHPEYTARERIVVSAELSYEESSPLSTQELFLEPDNIGATLPAEAVPAAPAPAPATPGTSGTPGTEVATPGSTPVDTTPGVITSTSPDDVTEGVPATVAAAIVPAAVATGSSDDGSGENAFSGGWFSDTAAWPQIILWGLGAVLVTLAAYALARWARRLWVGVLVGIAPFLVALYFFYENVNRMLPPGL